MPFGLLLDQVYGAVIAPALRAAGYRPTRGDTTFNQHAVMRDVIAGIEGADLVVADLTGRNANVFYELGLGHTLRRPTVMIAQTTDDIPFDLKAYRVVIYSLEFQPNGRIASSLRGELVPLLQAAQRGDVEFGNPFSDFGNAGIAADSAADEPSEGILDTLADFAVQSLAYMAALERMGNMLGRFGDDAQAVAARLADAEPGNEIEHAREVAADLAGLFDRHAAELEPIVDNQLSPMVLHIEAAARAQVRLAFMGSEPPDPNDERLESIRKLSASSAQVQAILAGHAAGIRKLSGIATATIAPGRRLAAVNDRIAAQLGRVAGLAESLVGPP